MRFVIGTHRIRGAKDAMSRYIVAELDKAGIGIASATYDIVGFPPIEIRQPNDRLAAHCVTPDDSHVRSQLNDLALVKDTTCRRSSS